MNYQVIARKWRPQAFEEVTGQEHITQTLRNAIEFDRLHHAYLFAGARGVGKTTTARLLAKALNCHKTYKPTLTPCKSTDPNPCPSCVEIGESRSIDVLEFDAASNTQVDKIREIILENINIRPARDRYKIFIIDEVHMLSTSSFNALLKTVEEPPPNVVFIMATTELHKVPETITSRCQEFMFRTIPQQKIFERLKFIAETEKVDVSEAALRELARSGEGSMRDAQSNFDQVISFSSARIEVADVTRALGMAGRDVLVKSIKAIADHDAKSQLEVVEQLISEGHDLRNFCRDLMSVIRDLMVYKVAGNSDILLEGAML
ncbi:MAG TPA: DNA polymerase III subunit gamma/tau, partial [Pyrinomonadaceae bacterium]|nr:DNA polymerase III subunit gamma/tau [Pyrinomonadaceae bacterium]